ncbi:Aste57867_15829 [Aphanomyces stellatus]|uniref:Aste57867_15829 protein n=1 Tax=Aphanomyces stellatus TaxID=120398 RepID=A0A485L700_9STRA|nr:hypothetical protein As57867_015773 [Aphanomyces stellatus]VFT92616.1 Aste57867_15829 [Aphanomyces stellatus]
MRMCVLLSAIAASTALAPSTAWVNVYGVDLTPTFGNADILAQDGVSTLQACKDIAIAKNVAYATLDGDVCKVYGLTYTYSLHDGVMSSARYNADNFDCFGNADFTGDDIWDTATRFERCLDACQLEFGSESRQRCNAVTWIQNPGEVSGHCYLKYLKDPLRAAEGNARGAIACRSRHAFLHGLGYVEVDGIEFSHEDDASIPNVTSPEHCVSIALSKGGRVTALHFSSSRASNASLHASRHASKVVLSFHTSSPI